MNIVKSVINFVMDILETVVFIGSLFMVIYLFICQPNKIQGSSMEPNFLSDQYIFTSKVTYKLRPIERGDVVVIHAPENYEVEYIKRVIGLPGDKLLFKDGQVYLNGAKLDENTYLHVPTPVWGAGAYAKEDQIIVVPSTDIFVMGDNRPKSKDSREFGTIPISSVIGQVFYRYYPVSKMGIVTNPLPSDERTKKISYIYYFDNVSRSSVSI